MTTDGLDLDDLTTAALADLDAAPPADLTPSQQARADALLASLVADPTASEVPDLAPVVPMTTPVPARRRRLRRLVVSAGAVAATTVGLLVLQNVTAGDTAYASWTAKPASVTTADERQIGEVCRGYLQGSFSAQDEQLSRDAGVPEAEIPRRADLDAATVAVAERRGGWSFALLVGPNAFEATCMLQRPGLLSRLAGEKYASAGGMLGRSTAPAPDAEAITITQSGAMSADGAAHVEVSGLVGAEVSAVVFTTPVGQVTASVQGGHFAAWWPSATSDFAGQDGSVITGRTVELYLRDGRVLRDLPVRTFEHYDVQN